MVAAGGISIEASRPSRARGLKPIVIEWLKEAAEVAPFTGAWIETSVLISYSQIPIGRALHGRVD